MKYKLIALDIDGTLKKSNNEVSKVTLDALMTAQKKGVKIVLASGRPTYGMRHDAKALKLDEFGGFLLSFNGARVASVSDDKPIHFKTLSVDDAKAIYDRAQEFNLACMTYGADCIITENDNDQYVQVESNINDIPIKKVEDFKASLTGPVNKLLLTGDPDYVASILDEFKAPFGDNLSIYRSAPFFIEVMTAGVDKAAAMEVLKNHLGIEREEIIAFGDGYNDKPMIEYAGTGVCMANGVDELKAASDYITLSNDEDGIVHALKELGSGVM